jgi:hypothetical protein
MNMKAPLNCYITKISVNVSGFCQTFEELYAINVFKLCNINPRVSVLQNTFTAGLHEFIFKRFTGSKLQDVGRHVT